MVIIIECLSYHYIVITRCNKLITKSLILISEFVVIQQSSIRSKRKQKAKARKKKSTFYFSLSTLIQYCLKKRAIEPQNDLRKSVYFSEGIDYELIFNFSVLTDRFCLVLTFAEMLKKTFAIIICFRENLGMFCFCRW